MGYRHEYKHIIHAGDRQVIRGRLRALGLQDPNAPAGEYLVRSLYFDDLQDTALRQKIDGVDKRDKFRIRYYNGDASFIRLEKKSKKSSLCHKRSTKLTRQEVEAILQGDVGWLPQREEALLVEFYGRLQAGLRPSVIVDYWREPFVYGPGNVRVTIDRDIRTGLYNRQLFDMMLPTVSAQTPGTSHPMDEMVLEVKYDGYLPDVIRQAVQLGDRPATAFSKYAQCRRFG